MGKLIAPLLGSLGVSTATAATIGTVVSGLGTALSIGSAISGSRAQQAQFGADIAATKYNSAIDTIQSSDQQRKMSRDQYLRAGSQMAAGGAQGRGQGGNLLDIMADTAYQSELDILGLRTANKMQQDLATSKVSSLKKSASTARMGSLLTTVSSIAGSMGSGISDYGASKPLYTKSSVSGVIPGWKPSRI
jgi:hypothetical protein